MTRRARSEPRPTFTLRLEGKPGADNIKSLRWVLKRLLRRYGLKCLDAREVHDREAAE